MATIYVPPATTFGQGNIFSSMCQEFCPQGGCLPHCMLGYTPPGEIEADIPPDQRQTPPPDQRQTHPLGQEADTPQDQRQTPPRSSHPPGADTPPQWKLGEMGNKRVVCNLLECNLVFIILMLQWVLHPIVMATTTKKLDIMATEGGVHTVATMATKRVELNV